MATLHNQTDDGSYPDDIPPADGWVQTHPTDRQLVPDVPMADAPTIYRETCAKCRGTGQFAGYSGILGNCFKCAGRGYNEFKTSPEQRAARAAKIAENAPARQSEKERRIARERERLAQDIAAWKRGHADEAAWIEANTGRFDFATSMGHVLATKGTLTDNMLAAIRRCIARDAERAEARATEQLRATVATVPVPATAVALTAVEEAFAKARAQGIQWPKLFTEGLVISPAGENSRNPGAIYVKRSGGDHSYLGMVMRGAFTPSRDCDDATRDKVLEALQDPMAAAIAYGKKYNRCSVCHRELSDPESVERGIGPICATRMGW